MITPQLISSLIALIIGFSIFWLVRKDRLITRDGLKWLFVAALVMVYGVFPTLNDNLGVLLGISYPPIIPVLVAIGVILVKLLVADIERAKQQVVITRLIQKIAILEQEIESSRKKNDKG
jgi:hypothetical protein